MNRFLHNENIMSLEEITYHNSKYLGSNLDLPTLESLVNLNKTYIDSSTDYLEIVKINQKVIAGQENPSTKRLNFKNKQPRKKVQALKIIQTINKNRKLIKKKTLRKYMSQDSMQKGNKNKDHLLNDSLENISEYNENWVKYSKTPYQSLADLYRINHSFLKRNLFLWTLVDIEEENKKILNIH